MSSRWFGSFSKHHWSCVHWFSPTAESCGSGGKVNNHSILHPMYWRGDISPNKKSYYGKRNFDGYKQKRQSALAIIALRKGTNKKIKEMVLNTLYNGMQTWRDSNMCLNTYQPIISTLSYCIFASELWKIIITDIVTMALFLPNVYVLCPLPPQCSIMAMVFLLK